MSEVLAFRSPTGEDMLRVIQLQSRTSPHRATLAQDYSKIQQATKQSKQQQYLSDWIEEKINSTFISVDERYQGCPAMQDWLNDSRQVGVRP